MRASLWAFRVGTITIPALIFLWFFYRLTARFTADEPSRRAALAAYALASPALPYSLLLLGHQLAAVCLGGSFYAAVELVRGQPRRPRLVAALGGLLGGMALMMDYQAVFAATVVGLYLLLRSRNRWRDVPIYAGWALPPIAALLTYHKICFGSPFRISYALGVDTAPKEGVLGFIGPNWEAFKGTLLVPSNGLVVLVPWVVLAVVGLVAIRSDPQRRRQVGAEAVAAAAVMGVYILFLGSMLPYMARGGWSAGPRQLVGMLPFAAWLAAAGFEAASRRLATRALAAGAVIASGVVFMSAVTTYPHWPDGLRNPLYELSFRLISHGYTVHSLGTALGLRGRWAIFPLYVGALGLCLWLLVRGRRRALLVAGLSCALAVALIGSYRRFPRTERYGEHVWNFVTRTWEPK
jgi:hypothetical protein